MTAPLSPGSVQDCRTAFDPDRVMTGTLPFRWQLLQYGPLVRQKPPDVSMILLSLAASRPGYPTSGIGNDVICPDTRRYSLSMAVRVCVLPSLAELYTNLPIPLRFQFGLVYTGRRGRWPITQAVNPFLVSILEIAQTSECGVNSKGGVTCVYPAGSHVNGPGGVSSGDKPELTTFGCQYHHTPVGMVEIIIACMM
jgi:hypothetical protein